MSDLGFIDVSAAVLNQTFTFNLGSPQTNQATLTQMVQGQSDTVIINNLSGCTFRVMFQPSGRSFTLPAGVPTNPLPLSYKGTNDSSCSLRVDSLVIGNFPSQVHFDWFSASEPILYVAAAAATSAGAITLTAITAGSITIPTPNNWVITEDVSGNLTFTNTSVAGAEFFLDASANIHIPNSTIANVDGTSTVGNYGVPLIVAQKLRQNVTGTGGVVILSYTPASAMILRVSGVVTLNRAAGTGTVTCLVQWTDTEVGTAMAADFYAINSGAGFAGQLTGATLTNLESYAIQPLIIDATSTGAVTVQYTDSAAGPNDFVTAIIERLA